MADTGQAVYVRSQKWVTASLKHDKSAGLLEIGVAPPPTEDAPEPEVRYDRLRYDARCGTPEHRCTDRCRASMERTEAMARLLCLMGHRSWTVWRLLDGLEHLNCEDVKRGATYACEVGVQNTRLRWQEGAERQALVIARPQRRAMFERRGAKKAPAVQRRYFQGVLRDMAAERSQTIVRRLSNASMGAGIPVRVGAPAKPLPPAPIRASSDARTPRKTKTASCPRPPTASAEESTSCVATDSADTVQRRLQAELLPPPPEPPASTTAAKIHRKETRRRSGKERRTRLKSSGR